MILDRIEHLRKQPLPVRQRATIMITFVSVAVITFIWFVIFFSTVSMNDFIPEEDVTPVVNNSGYEAPYAE